MTDDENNAATPVSRSDRLKQLEEFATVFEQSTFRAGEWHGGIKADGAITLPWFELGTDANRFLQAAYACGFVLDFDWMEWRQSNEACLLRDDATVLASADPDQLAKLVTVIIRSNRFCDGILDDAFETGLIRRIVQRAAILAAT